MRQPHRLSRSATDSESSSFGSWPSLSPVRSPRATCGACDMFSMPPATVTFASPRRRSCAALTIAWMPLPHSRLTVSAGTGTGMPALRATWRAP